jgi:hypothetical protein
MQYSRTNLPPAELFTDWLSSSGEGNCVEIAYLADEEGRWTAIRDSKNPSAIQIYDRAEWDTFRTAIIDGRLT